MPELARNRLFRWWAGVVSRRPWPVLLVAIAFAGISALLSLAFLEFRSNRSELLSPTLEWNQRFEWWASTFPSGQDLVVIVDTRDTAGRDARARAEALVDDLGEALAAAPRVRDAVWGFNPARVSAKAVRLLPMEAFEARLAQLAQAEPILRSATPGDLIAAAMQRMRPQADAAVDPAVVGEGIETFGRLLAALRQRLEVPATDPFDLGRAVEPPEPWRYLETSNGRFLVLRVSPELEANSLNAAEPAIREVRAVLETFRTPYPDLSFGLTGAEVVEADETAAATWDSTWTSILAAVLITTLLVVSFRSWTMPLLLLATLLIAIAWSFGFLTLVIGHLQVISVVFTLILLGLGVGFGIHLASRYELVRHDYPDHAPGDTGAAGFRLTIADVLTTTGPGVATGAITTAAAFVTTVFTDFTGVAEMGLIAGTGILLCVIAFFTVFPALLRLVKPRHRDVVAFRSRRLHLFHERWFLPFARHPKLTLVTTGAFVALSMVAMSQMRFDFNLLALLPRGAESVVWQERLIEDGQQSPYFGVSIASSLDEARQRAEAFRALPTVDSVGGIARLFPADDEVKRARIQTLRAALAPALAAAAADPPAPSQSSPLLGRLSALRLALGVAQGQAPPELRDGLSSVARELDRMLAAANRLTDEERAARLDALQRDYDAWRDQVAQRVGAALDPSPLRPDDLPPGLLSPYIAARDGQTYYQVDIYPAPPPRAADALNPAFLQQFVTQMRSVDPGVTGVIVQVFESGTLIWRSYFVAGLCALVIVFILVSLDFWSLREGALSLVPVAAGFAVTFAIMWLVGERVNPANIIVLPLMFGIGVDSGVHMLHRVRQHPGDRPRGLTHGTGKGITITALTTITGFGCMTLASHRGIASLGFVLALGIAMTLLACLTMMPAWLEMRKAP